MKGRASWALNSLILGQRAKFRVGVKILYLLITGLVLALGRQGMKCHAAADVFCYLYR